MGEPRRCPTGRGWAFPADEECYELDAGPTVEASYGQHSLQERDIDRTDVVDMPGNFPYTRGIAADGQREAPTLVKVYTGLGTPADTNERVQKVKRWGAEIIQLAADLPSQIGYDPDDVMSAGEVGRAGVSISSLRDLEIIFDGVPLSSVARVGMLANAIGPIGLALFLALGERQGLDVGDFVVDLQNDPLKEYVARGTQFLPLPAAVQLAADVVAWCSSHAPHFYPLDVCVNHLNAGGTGSTAGTAFALANATHYFEHLINRGLQIDEFASQIQMFLDEREDFFAALANVRATRRIWAETLRDRFSASQPDSMKLKVTAYGHGRETRREPLNNIVRITLGSLAYYLAGVQSLYTASYDEVIQTPSDDAVKIALRTQQIMALEIGLGLTADPLGGSYYVESLTREIEEGIRSWLDRVEQVGGALAAIESGLIRRVMTEGAERRQRRLEAGVRAMVGVDRLATDDDDGWAVRRTKRMSETDEEQRQADVAELRRTRDRQQVVKTLRQLEAALRASENSVPPVLEAVRAYATVGEIADVFREVFGEWLPDQSF